MTRRILAPIALLTLALAAPAEARRGGGGGGNFCARNPDQCDSDGDGLTNADELAQGTDPYDADTDGDGSDDASDAFPLDPSEWADADGDGLGDNADPDDNANGVDDAIELPGGLGLFDGAFPATMDATVCPWSLEGDPTCTTYVAELDGQGGVYVPAYGVTGEWDEFLDGNDLWTFLLAFPGLDTASQRAVGVRVVPTGTASTCYEGFVETLGGGYDAGTQQSWSYWFVTGEFSGCVR